MHTHLLPSFLLPLQSVSLLLSPQSGLFTTTSSRLKHLSYSAPGMPAAMQQSKRSVILYHLHPWDKKGRRVDRKRRGRGTVRGGTETGGQRGRQEFGNLWDWGECEGKSGGISTKKEKLAANTSSPRGLLGILRDGSKTGNKEREQMETEGDLKEED